MPNHVTNKIDLKVADLLSGEDGEIDFNVVIPMPKSLRDPDPQQLEGRAKAALGMYRKPNGEPADISDLTCRMELSRVVESIFSPLDADQVDLLIQAIKNIKDHGHAYWYPWACEKWGTKWNAYSVEIGSEFCTFQTAWSHPEPVFIRPSELNPAMEIKVEYADEDTGSNCGTVVYKAGNVVSEEISPGWGSLDDAGKEYWQRFALGITDPENIEERLAEYAEDK